jgi:hypothetical protein
LKFTSKRKEKGKILENDFQRGFEPKNIRLLFFDWEIEKRKKDV